MISWIADFWDGDWLERTMLALLAVAALLVVALVGYGIFCASDSWYVDDKDGTAVVVSHCHHAAYTSIVPVGKITIPQYHPERWSLAMEVSGGEDDFYVSRSDYNRISNGEQIRVRYRKGRFSDWTYITEAWL